MKKATFVATVVGILLLAMLAPAFGQGRPRRVDNPQPPPKAASSQGQSRTPAGAQPGTPTAQQPQTADDGGDETIDLESSLIEVPVVVADRAGHYIPRLRQEDFRLSEDGQPQQITFFSTERRPIHVALVMDTSGSTRDSIYDIQEAAIDFVSQLAPGDQVLLVSFASEVIVEQEFTNDRNLLVSAIRRTRANGATKLYEAAYLAVSERLAHIEGRKAMVILSDGDDTASKDVSFDEAVNVCSESDVVVYGIRYPDTSGMAGYGNPRNPRNPGGRQGSPWPNSNPGQYPPSYPQPRRNGGGSVPGLPRIPGVRWPFASGLAGSPQIRIGGVQVGGANGGDPFMEVITRNTGGQLYYADAVGDVRGLFNSIAEELRNVYILGYNPSNSIANGGYRKISVQVPAQPNLAVRHRLGYQADTYK